MSATKKTSSKKPATGTTSKAAKSTKSPYISIVVPMYNESETVQNLVKRVTDEMSKTKWTWELICVDDGSKDDTAKQLSNIAQKNKHLKPVFFRRNYGQTAAMQAGFDHATGEIIVTMDGDLQNDPKDIATVVSHMEKTGVDIVSGWRKDRQDHALKRNLPSRIANKLIGKMTGVQLHDYGCSLKAYNADLMKNVKIYGELHRFIPAIASQYGATLDEVVVTHHARAHGQSKYGIDRTFRVILDLILMTFFLKYQQRPMHAFGYLGLACLTPGGLMATYLTLLKLTGHDIGGRPLLMLSVMLILIGVQLIGMGIMGEVLMRIYHEPQGRKQYLTRATPKK